MGLVDGTCAQFIGVSMMLLRDSREMLSFQGDQFCVAKGDGT
jgi:hypothetical protein